jgi:hypothetical protein
VAQVVSQQDDAGCNCSEYGTADMNHHDRVQDLCFRVLTEGKGREEWELNQRERRRGFCEEKSWIEDEEEGFVLFLYSFMDL